jgi:hypothetical protein
MTDAILSAVLEDLRARSDGGTDPISSATFDRVTIGDAAVLVELSVGASGESSAAGLAHRPPGDVPDPAPWSEQSPDEFLREAFEGTTGRPVRAVGIATLNALSAPYLDWREGDPMALLDADVDRIVTVGLFRPAFRKFGAIEVRVIEREAIGDVPAPDRIDLQSFTPEETEAAMDGADVVFLTGSTLVYGGIERYLAAAPESATVVCVGATVSLLPDPLFDAGIDVVAGAEVVDVQQARTAVQSGACGTDLHDHGVRKVYVARDRPVGLDLGE